MTTEEEGSCHNSCADGDFEEGAEEGYDDEGTLDEEEMLTPENNYHEELKQLEDDANLSVDELRNRYYAQYADDDEQFSEEEQSTSLHSEESSRSYEAEESIHVNDAATTDAASAGPSTLPLPTEKSGSSYGYFTDEEDNTDDIDYIPPDPWRKQVRLGMLYQARVPPYDVAASTKTSDERGRLLWLPPDGLTNDSIETFLKEYYELDFRNSSSAGTVDMSRLSTNAQQKTVKDDENALKSFMDSGYDSQMALSLYPFPAVNAPRRSIRDNFVKWDETDCALFEQGIRVHGKNFFAIQRILLPHRTVGELVQFYYLWKKTERHDIFENSLLYTKRQEHAHCTSGLRWEDCNEL